MRRTLRINALEGKSKVALQRGQNESGRRPFLFGALTVIGAALSPPVQAEPGGLDPGSLTFRDFAVFDHGSSFSRFESTFGNNSANPAPSRVLGIDNDNGLARIRFDTIRVEASLPLGWQATEDWERGVGYSGDRRYRLLIWRVDFEFEGVSDAEHYAATKVGTIKARRPGVQGQARKLRDGTFLIVYENVPPSQGDTQRRVVFDLLMSKPGNPKEGLLMTLGVPASDTDRGLKLLALLKSRLRVEW
jgi:hypothetical protein